MKVVPVKAGVPKAVWTLGLTKKSFSQLQKTLSGLSGTAALGQTLEISVQF